MAKPLPVVLIAPGTDRKGAEFFDYSVNLSNAYPRALLAAGALPWILSCTTSTGAIEECVRRCDGVLLTGGDDIQPALYRRRLSPKLKRTISPADPRRDLAEITLIQEVFRQRKPLLAICRGQQMLNVAFGGGLIVDIRNEVPRALNHCRMDRKDRPVHPIDLAPDSMLAGLFGTTRLRVNSTHHQAVQGAVRPFRAVASSQDGIVEAMELGLADRHLLPYLLAVQFHPERLIQRQAEFLEIFRGFARACASVKKTPI